VIIFFCLSDEIQPTAKDAMQDNGANAMPKTIREVVAVFDDVETLDTAVYSL
jgi:hypothetical protein